MTDLKNNMIRYGLPVASFILSIAITIGGWIVASKVQDALISERLANLQRDQARHETEKSEQIRLAAMRTEEHEKRIIRLETSLDTIQVLLSEMKADIKAILKDNKWRH